jgi:hypothetical protein
MVAACRGVAEARRVSGREARFRATGGHSVRGEEPEPMKKLMSGLAIATIASTAFVGAALADEWIDTASTGNGGVSTADSDGGSVSIGDANNGGNSGSTTSIGGGGSSGGVLVLGDGTALTGENLAAQIIAAMGLE